MARCVVPHLNPALSKELGFGFNRKTRKKAMTLSQVEEQSVFDTALSKKRGRKELEQKYKRVIQATFLNQEKVSEV